MASDSNRYDVFLSYARGDDEPFVRRLCDDLTAAGLQVWFDRNELRSRGLTFHHEIRNAIDASDRLVLIVGPQAFESEYVRQEWQYAWFDQGKVVTPILRKPRGPKPAKDDYTLVPEELRALHCDDFRDDDQYASKLAKLRASLEAPPPKLGQLIAVPSLPPHFLSRADLLTELRDAVRAGLDSSAPLGGTTAHQKLAGIVGRQRMASMAGMGGIGKSVLALLLAHDRFVREAFPDGIVWAALGTSPSIVELQRRVHRDLGGDGAFEDVHEGKRQLAELLSDKSVLLILDDAWRRADVEAFDVLGPTCRALITTRDAQLVTSLGGTPHLVELLTDDEALWLLAATLAKELSQLPPEALPLIQQCGRLPLAVALAGGMIVAGQTWTNLLRAFERHKLAFFKDDQRDNQHHDLLRTIEVSVEALKPNEQARLIELGVFPENESVPEAAVASLWQHTGNLDDLDTSSLLVELKQRSLLRLTKSADDSAGTIGRLSLHDLIHDYCLLRAQQQFGSESALHERLLDAYRAKCPDGWSTGPHDGYFFERLVHHLSHVENWTEAELRVTDFRWLMRKGELGLLDSITNDFQELAALAPQEVVQRLQVWQDFFLEEAHILRRGLEDASTHKILLQLAVEHADDSPVTRSAEAWLAEDRCDWLRLQRVPRRSRLTKNACLLVLEGHTESVACALVLLDGRLLSASRDGTLRIWDAANGTCVAVLEGHTWSVTGALSLQDGRLLSWSKDNTLRLWDIGKGACLAILKGHTGCVDGALSLPEGRLLSWSWDRTLRVWDAASGTCRAVLEGHTGWILGALTLPEGRLLSWSWDGTLRVWDAANAACLLILEGHADPVYFALPLPDGRLLSWSHDKTLRIWDAVNGTCLAVLEGRAASVEGGMLLPGGRLLLWSSDGTLTVWDAACENCLAVLRGHTRSVGGAVSLPDGRLLSWSLDGTLRVWETESGICGAVLEGHTLGVLGALPLPDGRLLSWSHDTTLRVWDARCGTALAVLERHANKVKDALSLSDGRLLSWSGDGTLRVWDAESGICRGVLEGHWRYDVRGAVSLADGRLAFWTQDKTLRVWNAAKGPCLAVLEGHTDSVEGALSLPDGRLLSWSRDRTLRVWDAESGICRAVLEGHTSGVLRALSLPDGRLLSWSDFTTLWVWDAQSGTCLEVLSKPEAADRYPEQMHAWFGPAQPRKVVGDLTAQAARRTALLRHQAISSPLASWQAETESREVLRLLSDGTLVVGQERGEVCILKLYRGRGRVSLVEAADLFKLTSD